MINSISYKTKQFLSLVIKLSIVIGCCYFIHTKLVENEQMDFSIFYQNLIENKVFTLKNCLFLFFFSFFNWFLEITKWHLLISFIGNSSFKKAMVQSLASLTTSLITPNRIGEYGAKALYFEKPFRKKIIGLNLVGNFYQMLMTLVFGVMGFSYFILKHKIEIKMQLVFRFVSVLLFVVFTLFFVCKFLIYKNSYFKKTQDFMMKIPLVLHLNISFLSLLRFLIFSHQFYFLLLIFNIDVSYIEAISAITSMYLVASIIPVFPLFDFVTKSSIALWIFSFFSIEPFTIVSITTLMWILNIVLPAIIGSYFVLIFKPNFNK